MRLPRTTLSLAFLRSMPNRQSSICRFSMTVAVAADVQAGVVGIVRRTRIDEPQATQDGIAGSQHGDGPLAAAVDRHRAAAIDGQRLVDHQRPRVDARLGLRTEPAGACIDEFLQERQTGNATGLVGIVHLLVDAAPTGCGRRRHVAEAPLAGIEPSRSRPAPLRRNAVSASSAPPGVGTTTRTRPQARPAASRRPNIRYSAVPSRICLRRISSASRRQSMTPSSSA
jgi:hypothetical protein